MPGSEIQSGRELFQILNDRQMLRTLSFALPASDTVSSHTIFTDQRMIDIPVNRQVYLSCSFIIIEQAEIIRYTDVLRTSQSR